MALRFKWDEAKNRTNQRKHGVSFELASEVFDDPHCVMFLDRHVEGEDRWLALGWVDDTLVAIAHTMIELEDGSELIRIISARQAAAKEKRLYETANG